MGIDYLCEAELKRLNPKLHQIYRDSVVVMQEMLQKYQAVFPTYTDHTALHSIDVINFCNAMIGEENIGRLNADELYILLMSAYLHDSGMGVSRADYECFSRRIDFGDTVSDPGQVEIAEVIRLFHQEFSGEYIRKYAPLFDIPTSGHTFAIIQVSRGHRKTDLYDEQEYPDPYILPNGNHVCIVYLAALLRLADELDIAADRNLQFVYDLDRIDNEVSRMEFRKHQAIRRIRIMENAFLMEVDKSDPEVFGEILELKEKLGETLTYCRTLLERRTKFSIRQKEILVVPA